MFDSHAHYGDDRFAEDRHELLKSLFASEITGIVEIGTDQKTSFESYELARQYENMYFAVGIHPEFAEQIGEVRGWLPRLAAEEKCAAIGEIGLDYHYDTPSKEAQMKAFEAQLCLAEELGKPVIIHDRDAHGDCLEAVRRHPNVKGVFHSFSGSAEMAKILVELGWYISFSGVLTFKNAVKPIEAASVVPTERLLVETDCPYLAPHPFRGQRNDSRLMAKTLEKLSEIKNVSFSEMERITTENAHTFFRIKGK